MLDLAPGIGASLAEYSAPSRKRPLCVAGAPVLGGALLVRKPWIRIRSAVEEEDRNDENTGASPQRASLRRFPPDTGGVKFGLQLFYLLLARSEEHTSELQSLMRNSYAVFCLKKKQ